jgi:hypothetical protein
MSLSGKQGCSEVIVKEFSTPRCLKTYRGERNPSVSANCNALLSLLVDEAEYESKVVTMEKIITFVYDSWMKGKCEVKDKWVSKHNIQWHVSTTERSDTHQSSQNVSPHYTRMLISRSLVELLLRWGSGSLPTIDNDVIALQAVPLLLKCLSVILETQSHDGAWGSIGPFEETAYAILALVSLLSLPLPTNMYRKAVAAMEKGRGFLLTLNDTHCEFLWVEKVTYGSKRLMNTYVLTALNAKSEALWERFAVSSAGLSYHNSNSGEILSVQGLLEDVASGVVGVGVGVET